MIFIECRTQKLLINKSKRSFTNISKFIPKFFNLYSVDFVVTLKDTMIKFHLFPSFWKVPVFIFDKSENYL